MASKTRRAAVVEIQQDGTKVIRDDSGELTFYPRGSMGFPSAPVGSIGYIEYRTGPSYGLWFFVPDETPGRN
jgi:hypothetical protein